MKSLSALLLWGTVLAIGRFSVFAIANPVPQDGDAKPVAEEKGVPDGVNTAAPNPPAQKPYTYADAVAAWQSAASAWYQNPSGPPAAAETGDGQAQEDGTKAEEKGAGDADPAALQAAASAWYQDPSAAFAAAGYGDAAGYADAAAAYGYQDPTAVYAGMDPTSPVTSQAEVNP
ncbi:hypothetical protein HK102_008538, partial [Quaeritorhiza haematococci]